MRKLLPLLGYRADQNTDTGVGSGFRVISSVLRSGELLPVLVDPVTWVPRSLALRWVLFKRRYECAESTLRNNVDALRHLYAWGDARFEIGLERRVESAPLDPFDLLSLAEFLNTRGAPGPAEVGRRAVAAKMFLIWALSPSSRNQRGAEPMGARDYAEQIETVLGPFASRVGEAREGEAPEEALLQRIDSLLAPVSSQGRFLVPLRWVTGNPFRRDTRLRNWLMWMVARDCGLRIGEILTLRMTDMQVIRGVQCAAVVRRPNAAEDTRLRRPSPKTLQRVLPLGPHATFALGAYVTTRPPTGRRRGSPYLFTSRTGAPLSLSSADRLMDVLSTAVGHRIHWHALRHAWADDIARGVLRATLSGRSPSAADAEAQKALLTEQLRLLGGWSESSNMPMRYARRAIKEYADANLRVRQQERARRILEYRASEQ